MKDELTIKDFLVFLKDNLKLILGSMGILLAVIILLFTVNFILPDASEPVEPSSEVSESSTENYERLAEIPFELLTEREVRFLQDYVEATSYKFMFFVENENGEPVGNLNMMRAIFRHQNVIDGIEERLGEELTPDATISINVVSYADSGLFELQLGRKTREESEVLAQELYEMISNNEIPVLNQFNVTPFEDQPIPLTELVEVDEVDETVVVERNNMEIIRNGIIYLVVGLFGGVVIGLIIAIIKMVFSKKISALFNYEKDFTDKIVRFNHIKGSENLEDKIKQNIIYPINQQKLVIFESVPSAKTKKMIDNLDMEKNTTIVNDFSDINQSDTFDEVIIISEVNETSKQWYHNQRLQLNGYELPIKIIQL